MITLRFPLYEVLKLAEHAVTAPEHAPSYNPDLAAQPPRPRLMWVKDDGTYMMSSGIPGPLHDPANPESNVVVYADGYGPGSRQDLGHIEEIGRDDFIEDFPLDAPFSTDKTFLEALRETAALGYQWLTLDLPNSDQCVIGMAPNR
ncbi:hypothetical protein HDA40_002144 [Hamadaea flava]|uniref:DUF3085 domain-containing protein n=1 Tax=Hamadaea flava TaxID=1742688 RepID=A0ABV8LJN3_9ACTN|nr:DUF3085 domain-containing protein [Hamadaea flava]MCP2323637.1 hypothetical protein [Hamadaea flava]